MSKFILSAFADEAGKSLQEQIDAMVANGVSCLEIRGIDDKNIADLTVAEAKEIRSRLADSGLCTWSIGSPIGKIGITDDFGPHLDKFKHVLELADVLEADCIRLFSFYTPKGEAPEQYKDEVFARLNKFCEVAKDSSVLLCHENEKGIYGDIARRCVEIMENVPDLYAIFDPANFIQSGQETMEAWQMLNKYVKYLHIKDSLADGKVVPAGMGEGNLPYIIKAYGEQGGEVMTLEPHLFAFTGLSALEREGEKSVVGDMYFPSPRDAFDAAVNAVKKIIAE